MRFSRFAAIMRKETRQAIRDPSTLMIAGLLPIMLIFLFGYAVSFDPRQFSVGVVVEQPTGETESFVASLRNTRYFEIETAPVRKDFETLMAAGELDAIIILPQNFSAIALRGEAAPIQILVDGGDPNTAGLVGSYIELLVINWLEQEWLDRGQPPLAPLVSIEPRVWFNAEISSRNYLVPGSAAIILTIIGTLLTALVVAREWERGTMEALLATPVGPLELLLGKLVPYFVLGLGSFMLSVFVAVAFFDVPFRGSFLALSLAAALFMLCSLGQGLLISTLTRNQLVAAQVAVMLAFLPAFYFSNFVFELDSMPLALQLFSYAIPARFFVSTLQTQFLAGNVWSVLLPDLAALAIFAIVIFAICALFTRTRLD